jgi:hypothetical protein
MVAVGVMVGVEVLEGVGVLAEPFCSQAAMAETIPSVLVWLVP